MPHTTAPTPSPAAAPSLPPGIEIFAPGQHVDDAGRPHQFTSADVAAMAAAYNPALCEAPLCVGHPQDNLPAYGWVGGLAVNERGALVMHTHSVEPQFAQLVQQKRYAKRSASFYAPSSPYNPKPGQWYLRHVAFLGAQPPAVAGLKDIQFSADDSHAVCFSTTTTPTTTISTTRKVAPTMTEDEIKALQAELAQAKAQAEAATAQAQQAQAEAASFAQAARAQRLAGFTSFAQAQVEAGRLLPKDAPMLAATLDALADVQPVSFAQADGSRSAEQAPVQWLQDLLSKAAPVVSFGQFAPASAGTGTVPLHRPKTDAELDSAARAWQAQHPNANYAQALAAITASFSASATV